MKNIILSSYCILLFFSSLTLVQASKFCAGNFAPKTSVCKKFQFDKLTNTGQCTDSNKKTTGVFKGIKLSNCTTFYSLKKLPNQSISNQASKMAVLITNVFENGNTKLGFAAVEKLGDCRGYTCGHIGFTTGTNDAYAVVKEYVKRVPKAPLKKYLNELKRLSKFSFGDPKRDDTKNLSGFPAAWKKAACEDPNFTQTQLDMGSAMYMKPAMKYAASVKVRSNLGKAIFYDTIVQHGWQYVEGFINLPRIIKLTGPRKANESEKSYLTRFLTIRRQLVCCFPGGTWNGSADRMQDFQYLVNAWDRNKDLKYPVKLKTYGATVTGKESITFDSHRCKKKPTKTAKAKSLPIPDTCPS
ncbi:lysozyme-like domain-containing protein [Pilobolus umbonatus]|nr:lysozyme-like domain-containing protein [Pilobolus umbonatus]